MREIESALDHGWESMRERKYEDARRIFAEAVAKAPKHLGAIRALATSCLRLSRFDEAESLLRAALSIDSSDWKSMSLLADTLGHKGQLEEQIEVLRLLVKYQPSKDHFVNLCRGCVAVGLLAEAAEVIRAASPTIPEIQPEYVKLAETLRKIGNNEQAMDLLSEGINRFPDNTAMLSLRGRMLGYCQLNCVNFL